MATVDKEYSDIFQTGQQIYHYRKDMQSMTQESLAELVDDTCSGKEISYIENGIHAMRIDRFFRIADALGVTPNDISPERFRTQKTPCISNAELYEKLSKLDPISKEHIAYLIVLAEYIKEGLHVAKVSPILSNNKEQPMSN